MLSTPAELVEGLAETWGALVDVCAGLGADDWRRPTRCPGWSVQDHVSHVIGLERTMAGEPDPDHELPSGLDHVRSPSGQWMELAVDVRRARSGAEVLGELREVTAARLAWLRALDDEGFDTEVPGPMGSKLPLLPFLGLRVFDCWVHEQDVRDAVGAPGGLDGRAAEHSRDQILQALPVVVAQRAEVPVGTVVVAEVGEPQPRTGVVEVGAGGAGLGDTASREPDVTLRCDLSTFCSLGAGRIDPVTAPVTVHGDAALARRVLVALAITP